MRFLSRHFTLLSDFLNQLYSELLSTGAEQENPWTLSWYMGQHYFCFAGYGDTILLLFVHSVVHRLYQRGLTAGRDFFLSNFFPYGGHRKSCIAYEYLWGKSRCHLCGGRACDCRSRWYNYRKAPHGKIC